MFKKTLATLVAATVIFGGVMSTPAMAAPGKDLRILPVIVNGQKVKFPDTEPYINTDGRTMVPVRFVSEMMGAEVKWEIDTQTAIVLYDGKTIRMPIGSKTVSVDGTKQELDTAAEFAEGRTMVPLRFVSEVLGSEVKWDNEAHSVRVTDAEYQAKVDAGTVTLDPWGREYSKTWDANWTKLIDLESTNFYNFYGAKTNREFVEPKIESNSDYFRETADTLSKKISDWYEAQLNVDYRTINEDTLIKAFFDNASPAMPGGDKYMMKEALKKYVKWVKDNKIVAKGYADPEMSSVFRNGKNNGLLVWVPTHFKFMIISANDSAQTFMDNWDVSDAADSFQLKKGVWYDGYSVVSMSTNVANSTWGVEHGIRHAENMFYKGMYFFNTVE